MEMERVNSVDEARAWFLSHDTGKVIAVNCRDEEKECSSYPDAAAWITDCDQ